ncbi:MAG: hypothetical protein OXE44_19680 [Nitrospinae bacterium]|nr:hypothetical protein [Nitrospinota bacterium]
MDEVALLSDERLGGKRGLHAFEPGTTGPFFQHSVWRILLAMREEKLNERLGERLNVPDEKSMDDRRPSDPAMPGRRARRKDK